MAEKNTAVFEIFQTRAQTEKRFDTLVDKGFRSEDISVLMSDNIGIKDSPMKSTPRPPKRPPQDR
jgi:hypothetical protein